MSLVLENAWPKNCGLPRRCYGLARFMLFLSAACRFYHKYSIILVWKMMLILLTGLLLLFTPVKPRVMEVWLTKRSLFGFKLHLNQVQRTDKGIAICFLFSL